MQQRLFGCIGNDIKLIIEPIDENKFKGNLKTIRNHSLFQEVLKNELNHHLLANLIKVHFKKKFINLHLKLIKKKNRLKFKKRDQSKN